LFIRNSIVAAFIAFFVCIVLNIISSSGIPYNIFSWQSAHWIPGSGGLQALAFGGIIVSLLLMKNRTNKNIKNLYVTLFCFGVVSLVSGFLLRNYFVLNKNLGTPTWVMISLSTAIFLFICLHWLTDVKKILSWYEYIKIAGTATLTCYLIPYFFYSFRTLVGLVLPEFLRTGILGLVKSFLYSLLIISICWGLKKVKIQLKI
jgi:predicted acyltransferase